MISIIRKEFASRNRTREELITCLNTKRNARRQEFFHSRQWGKIHILFQRQANSGEHQAEQGQVVDQRRGAATEAWLSGLANETNFALMPQEDCDKVKSAFAYADGYILKKFFNWPFSLYKGSTFPFT